jgi:hypothetical protein
MMSWQSPSWTTMRSTTATAPLCLRLKERDIPFVIYSGFSKVSGIAAEAPLVQKPARAEVLIATVEALLPEPV